MNCPECNTEILEIPKREPLPKTTLDTTANINYAGTAFIGESYSPTTKDYKCSNPKCWVTKINLSWS